MFAPQRRQRIWGPPELFALGCVARFFLLPRSHLPPPPGTPPPPRAKFLNKASPGPRSCAVRTPFPALVCGSILGEETQKLHGKGGGGGAGLGKAVRSRRVPALPRSHSCSPGPGRSGGGVSALPRNGLRSGGRRGDAGAGAARAFTTSLAFFVDFSVLGSTDLFARRGKCPHNEQLTALVTSGCLWASAALLPRPPAAPARPGPRGDRRKRPEVAGRAEDARRGLTSQRRPKTEEEARDPPSQHQAVLQSGRAPEALKKFPPS